MSRKARDMGHPRRSFAYGNTQGPSTSLGMTGLGTGLTGRRSGWKNRSEPAECFFGWSGGLAVPESFFWLVRHD
jgi:hypothetical protein